jgi:nitrogen fixation-related uncharacterized protein
MYFLEWIILTVIGTGVGIGLFVWAVRTGQFSEQGRARYLPLDKEPLLLAELPSRISAEVYVLLLVIGIWFIAMLCTLFLTFF